VAVFASDKISAACYLQMSSSVHVVTILRGSSKAAL